MGRILGLKTINDEKVVVNLEISSHENKRLKGNLENIYLFCEDNLIDETKIVQRGKKDSTKYFLLPKQYRKELILSERIICKRIELENKSFFVFEVYKSRL